MPRALSGNNDGIIKRIGRALYSISDRNEKRAAMMVVLRCTMKYNEDRGTNEALNRITVMVNFGMMTKD